MTPRQTDHPRQWLIADDRPGAALSAAAGNLPRGSGVLLLAHHLAPRDRMRLVRALRSTARRRGLVLIDEAQGGAARVHDARELRRAMLARRPVVLLSPLFSTPSHPEWRPLPRMRAAALARLGDRGLFALGGMNERRFRRVAPLGFVGWAGVGAWFRT